MTFEEWFEKVMIPRRYAGENIYKKDCRLAWEASRKEHERTTCGGGPDYEDYS